MNNVCKVLIIDFDSSVEIFRLSTHSWELLVDDVPFFHLLGCQVEIRGVLYWIGGDDDGKMLLVSFDGRTELFSRIELSLPQLWNNKIFGVPVDYSTQVLFLFNESVIYIHDLKNGSCTFLGTHRADGLLSCPNYVESVALLDVTRGE
ncbi:hypothetical protein LIER_28102 [Lithospermum erythrorhizon]|uniref:F-box associated beta-propeller type 1 domain-containing protein n=1 Tax=Lithospermum erythrorhizon TaxID=34254 RepID=A0AAV3RG11_LITER